MVDTPTANAPSAPRRNWQYFLQGKIASLFFLGFGAGLPFPLVYSTLSAWLQEAGLSTSAISTFAWIGFAYAFKFIWSPIVDATRIPILCRLLGRRRGWLFAAQLGVCLSLLLLAQMDPSQTLAAFAAVALMVALLSATQDIVLDAYRVEIGGEHMQAELAASYQYGYRLAIVVSGAGALYLAEYGSWSISYSVMAACMSVGMIATLMSKEPEVLQPPQFQFDGSMGERIGKWMMVAVVGPFVDFFKRYGKFAVMLLSLMAMYRISDYVLGILANPFYLIIGFTKTEIANIAKLYGLWIALFGIGAGGWAVIKFGVIRCLILATVLIATTNLFFALLVVTGPNLWVLALTISFDNFAQGFSGTVFIAYLSSLTNIQFTATQYALFSSVSVFVGKFAAGYSGNVQETIGWFGFFVYAAAVGIPAIILSIVVARNHKEHSSGG